VRRAFRLIAWLPRERAQTDRAGPLRIEFERPELRHAGLFREAGEEEPEVIEPMDQYNARNAKLTRVRDAVGALRIGLGRSPKKLGWWPNA